MDQLIFNGTSPLATHCSHMDSSTIFLVTGIMATHCSHMDTLQPPCITPCNMSVLKNTHTTPSGRRLLRSVSGLEHKHVEETPSRRRLLRSVSGLEHKHVEETTPSDMCLVLANQLVDIILTKLKIHRQL
jgi:hypothetical protein